MKKETRESAWLIGHRVPSALEIVTTRKFDAPLELVFDVLTEPEHVRRWFAAFEDEVITCSIDLRVGGDYRIDVVTADGTPMVDRACG